MIYALDSLWQILSWYLYVVKLLEFLKINGQRWIYLIQDKTNTTFKKELEGVGFSENNANSFCPSQHIIKTEPTK